MNYYIIYLRSIATFAVIMLHASTIYVSNFSIASVEGWKIANIIDGLLRICVPIFLMITGALLLGKDEPIKDFLWRRGKRVLIPFLFWNVIYVLIQFYKFPTGLLQSINIILGSFINGASFHFWYIYLILGIYLIIPIIRKWSIQATQKELLYFIIIWGVTLFSNKFTEHLFPNNLLTYFAHYLGYLVLGFYLHKYPIKFPNKSVPILLFAIGSLSTIMLTQYYTFREQQFIDIFYNYLSPNVAIAAIGIFLLLKNSNCKDNTLFQKLDSVSFGIYLIHIIILDWVNDLFVVNVSNNSVNVALDILSKSILTYILCAIIIQLLSTNKQLKKLVT